MRTFRYEDQDFGRKRSLSLKPSYRKWSLTVLLVKIRDHVAAESLPFVIPEELSAKYCAKKHMVIQCLDKLRLEGLVGREYNLAPEGSNRDPVHGHERYRGWQATRYEIIK